MIDYYLDQKEKRSNAPYDDVLICDGQLAKPRRTIRIPRTDRHMTRQPHLLSILPPSLQPRLQPSELFRSGIALPLPRQRTAVDDFVRGEKVDSIEGDDDETGYDFGREIGAASEGVEFGFGDHVAPDAV